MGFPAEGTPFRIDLGDGTSVDFTAPNERVFAAGLRARTAVEAGKPPDLADLAVLMGWLAEEEDRRHPGDHQYRRPSPLNG